MTNELTLDALRRTAFNAIGEIGKYLEPDDDWTPTLITIPRNEQTNPAIILLPNVADSGKSKDDFAHVLLPSLLMKARARMAAFVITAWQSEATPQEIAEFRGRYKDMGSWPETHRSEVVMLWLCDADTSQAEEWTVPIVRHKDAPPTLGEWQRRSEKVQGRFGPLLMRAFRRARLMTDLANAIGGTSFWEGGLSKESDWANLNEFLRPLGAEAVEIKVDG